MRHNVAMTNFDSDTAAQRDASVELRPDARLIALHSERGDAHSRLESALAALEGAAWGMTLAGEAALARQLRALLGAGVLRTDPRLPLRRDLLAEAGLAAAGLDGDWRGAVAVWLLEPGEEDLRRAERAGVPVIVDATLAPGAHWLAAGAQHVTYHHGAALTGFADGELALLFGAGERPAPAAPAAADLTAALALRDVATLPLRLARAAQTAASLERQLSGRALPLGPTALLLPPEAAAATAAPLGGVQPAARPVQGGVILTPGLADVRQVRALLSGQDGQAEGGRAEEDGSWGERTEHRRGRQDHRSGQASGQTGGQTSSQQTGHTADLAQAAADARPDQRQQRGRPDGEREQPQAPAERQGRPPRQEQGSRRFQRTERFQGTERSQGERGQGQPAREQRTPGGRHSGLERFVFEAPAAGHAASAPAPAEAHPNRRGTEEQGIAEQGTGEQGTSEGAGRQKEANTQDIQARDTGRNETQQRGRPPQAEQLEAEQPSPQPAALQPEAPQPEVLQPDLPLPSAAQPGSGKPDPAADLTEEQSAVFARLRDWRNAEASRQEISRFIVASNATLAEIARRVPYTVEDLQSIKGMGPARLSKYGEAIVQVVRGTRN